MADIPKPRSYAQCLADIRDAFQARQQIANFRVGSPLLSAFEAAARSDLRSSHDLFGFENATSLDSAEGTALARTGADENVPQLQQSTASGKVTITDTSFQRLASKIFSGSAAPIAGSVLLDVTDASAWPGAGNVYIGRGTPNYEGPLAYSAKADNGTHWTLTFVNPTIRFHATSEAVVLAQGGNRQVGPGTVVRTPQASVADAVEFTTLYATTIADGETTADGVLVQARKPGKIGNVAAGSIREFASIPFTGATVTNSIPFSSGLDTETQEEWRERIRAARRSRARGTALAIRTAVTGVVAPDENKRVSSATVVSRLGSPSVVVIDDGTGYEERSTGAALETITDSALGGEQYFTLTQRPVAKAIVVTGLVAPFEVVPGSSLTVRTGTSTQIHFFDSTSFVSAGAATAFEVAGSINADADLLYSARTTDGGTRVALFAKSEDNDDLEVVPETESDANGALGFPVSPFFTLQLYRNDRLLTKDGSVARVVGEPFPSWGSPGSSATLTMAVDGTPAITTTFTAQDFVDAKTGFAAVGRNSVAAWVSVINAKVPGLTASIDAGRLVLTSNSGPTGRARLEIVGGSLVSAHFFSAQIAAGQPRDYTLDRSTGEIKLEAPLEAGDRLTAGSNQTRAFVQSELLASPTTLASDAELWFAADDEATLVPQGITPTNSVTVAPSAIYHWGHEARLTAATGTFTNVRAGDQLVAWDPALPSSLRGAHRVSVTNSDTYVAVERRSGLACRAGHGAVALAPVGSAISKVLVTGGYLRSISDPATGTPSGSTTACEIFDPNTNVASPSAPMGTARCYHTATLAGNGKVVVVGGLDATGTPLATIEVYDPSTDTWTTSTQLLFFSSAYHRAVALLDGTVLICGGSFANTPISRAYVYNATSDTLTSVGNMATARWSHGLVLLPSGDAMVAGGYTAVGTRTTTTERYNASAQTWATTAALPAARADFGLAVAGTTQVVAAGSTIGQAAAGTEHVYTIGSDTWAAGADLPSSHLFEAKAAITLHSGDVALLHTRVGTTHGVVRYNTGGGFSLVAGDVLMAETATKYEVQYVLVSKADASYLNHVVATGGLVTLTAAGAFQPVAAYETWDGNTNTWGVPDAATGTFTLLQAGIALVRAAQPLQRATIAAGSNYTARSIADSLNAELVGMTASTYRTNRLRVATNTFGTDGNVALLAQNAAADALSLSDTDTLLNLTAHAGSVESGHAYLGTPSFRSVRVLADSLPPATGSFESLLITPGTIDTGAGVVGLRAWPSDTSGAYAVSPAAISPRFGRNVGTKIGLRGATDLGWGARVDVRSPAPQPWTPLDRFYLAAPYAFATEDTLTVAVDDNQTQRSSVALARRLTTVGNTYSQTSVFRDSNGATLAAAFGLNFSFNDFAVITRARALAFPATTRAMLFRYFRDGRDGETARVRFSNPVAANDSLSVVVDGDHGDSTDVRVRLKAGAARTLTVRPTTQVGYACLSYSGGALGNLVFVLNLPIASAARTANVTTLTLTLPSGITNHGFAAGNVVWVTSTSGSFLPGTKTITSRTNTTVSYTEIAADATASNIGTTSFDSAGEATTTGSGATTGDFWRLEGGTFGLFAGETFHTNGVSAGTVTATAGEAGGFPTVVVLTWGSLATATLKMFANPAQTATQVQAAIAAAQSTTLCPVTATLIGSGAGLIDRSTPEDLVNALAWYNLTDGYNYVASTTAPGSPTGDYSLTFKNPVTGSLSTGADWVNEQVWIAPTTAANVVAWLNAPAISGLFVGAEVRTSSGGTKVQIATKTIGALGGVDVQGGTGNTVAMSVVGSSRASVGPSSRTITTVRRHDADGLRAGMWCAVQNPDGVPRTGIFTGSTALVSWSVDGTVVVSTPVYTERVARADQRLQFERQGDFVAVSDFGGSFNLASVVAGDYLRAVAPASPTGFHAVSPSNQGVFRIVRVDVPGDASAGTVWIENTSAIEEVAECSFAIYASDSMMPGDTWLINTPIWGADNQGRWTIEEVGTSGSTQFINTATFKVATDTRAPVSMGGAPSLTSSADLVRVVEGVPARFVLQIRSIWPNQDNSAFFDIRWDSLVQVAAIGSSSRSVISALDKLAFPAGRRTGRDGYSYNVGLIGEVNRVIQGDPGDPATYPGVAAEGSRILVSGPLVRRVRVALSIRTRTRVARADLAARVRNAVASAIDGTPMGTPIALSKIVTAAASVAGVAAVAVVNPAFTAVDDRIPVQANEKPRVLNLDQDIQISFVGD